jgi:DNA-binding PadR family transcriptional regulator
MPRPRAWSPQTHDLVAALLDARGEWIHGYDLSKQTGLKSGTLYPLLMRLSDQGVLKADWQDAEQTGRPPRHVYRLTAHGLALAREAAAQRRQPAARRKVKAT